MNTASQFAFACVCLCLCVCASKKADSLSLTGHFVTLTLIGNLFWFDHFRFDSSHLILAR